MIKIKICGLTSKKDIEIVNALKPDYIGFVFAKTSKRYITPERAKQLRGYLDAGIQVVGVFVNEPIEFVLSLCQQGIIDMIQLHGKEDDEYVKKLRFNTTRSIIQAYEIRIPEDVNKANTGSADYVLLDNGSGGTGESFDWSLLEKINRPFFLAGGLQSDNVLIAIEKAATTNYLYGVDTSSGVETNGFKDCNKIEEFIKTVRER